ncbi:anthranilate phosphoribosyltransferase [Methylonatrum kenyense]|uniref:anthranilate phosphoribosyltransferase n=1 Tax=Methylonatrum kenyense TaxID=455253 RepID=UPI0020BDF5F9|nr:anthranilate phosphoribosyltransferase [Methylonatrum kenyense]MCK8516611.1 anthranilate phosphoribosyltransferase [Methylonatrum kenyense]
MDMQTAIRSVVDSRDLSVDDMASVMRTIMTGEATPAQIGGFLVGLRMKGETVDEITAAARVMRELATAVPVSTDHLVDTCGTGGDASGTFNVSTATAFVVAAAGGRVAKHGNRSVSSSSGSADLLEAAGARLDLDVPQVAESVEQVGVGFLFAPLYHSAMRYAIGPRKEMAVRTIFNVLGPLTNPAGAPNQLLGVFSPSLVLPIASVLQQLGSRHVMVVHAEDGLDEITISGETQVAELRDGVIREYTIRPEDFGMTRVGLDAVRVKDAQHSLAMIRTAFSGEPGPASDMIALNGGAAIYLAGLAESLADGVLRAQKILHSGGAAEKLAQFVAFSQSQPKA